MNRRQLLLGALAAPLAAALPVPAAAKKVLDPKWTVGSDGVHWWALTFKGPWDPTKAYEMNDVVNLRGTTYVCVWSHDLYDPIETVPWVPLVVGVDE